MNIYPDKIYHEDCVIGLKSIKKHSADIIIADPPYNIGKDFGNDSDCRSLDDYINWCRQWLKQCMVILKPTGTLFIYGFSEILAHICVLLPEKYGKRWLIWHYTNKNVASCNFWQRSHESILCVTKSSGRIFNRDLVREPYTTGFLSGSAGKARPPTKGRFSSTGKETVYNAHPNGALPRDVITGISALAGGASLKERLIYCRTCKKLVNPTDRKLHEKCNVIIHPTQKPRELTKKLILSCKPETNGFNVLIPFCGSGSECLVVKELGGSFISFELNKNYIRLATKALAKRK